MFAKRVCCMVLIKGGLFCVWKTPLTYGFIVLRLFSLSFSFLCLFFFSLFCLRFFAFCLRRIKNSFVVLYRKQTAPGRFLNVAFGAAKRV